MECEHSRVAVAVWMGKNSRISEKQSGDASTFLFSSGSWDRISSNMYDSFMCNLEALLLCQENLPMM